MSPALSLAVTLLILAGTGILYRLMPKERGFARLYLVLIFIALGFALSFLKGIFAPFEFWTVAFSILAGMGMYSLYRLAMPGAKPRHRLFMCFTGICGFVFTFYFNFAATGGGGDVLPYIVLPAYYSAAFFIYKEITGFPAKERKAISLALAVFISVFISFGVYSAKQEIFPALVCKACVHDCGCFINGFGTPWHRLFGVPVKRDCRACNRHIEISPFPAR